MTAQLAVASHMRSSNDNHPRSLGEDDLHHTRLKG
jgi:hypothetical protein